MQPYQIPGANLPRIPLIFTGRDFRLLGLATDGFLISGGPVLTFLFAKDPLPALTAPTAIYVRVCVLMDLEIASLRRLRALQYSRSYVRFGFLFWSISSLKAGELLILIPYLARGERLISR